MEFIIIAINLYYVVTKGHLKNYIMVILIIMIKKSKDKKHLFM